MQYRMVTTTMARPMARGMTCTGSFTSSATFTMSSNPMNAKNERNAPDKIPFQTAMSEEGIISGNLAGSVAILSHVTQMTMRSPATSTAVTTAIAMADSLMPQMASSPMRMVMTMMMKGAGTEKNTWKYPTKPWMMPATATDSPTSMESHRTPNASKTYRASPLLTGKRDERTAKEYPVRAERTAETRNATGVCMPDMPATLPMSA